MRVKYRVNRIENMQTADTNYLTDNVYFEGCKENCEYCFNPKLKEQKSETITRSNILNQLTEDPDVWVALMGGEPYEQEDLCVLIADIHSLGKKVITFTSKWYRWMGEDHTHVDIKLQHSRTYNDYADLSFGIVAYLPYLPLLRLSDFSRIKTTPIYVKRAMGFEDGVDQYVGALKELTDAPIKIGRIQL